jgi:hypothetical protein
MFEGEFSTPTKILQSAADQLEAANSAGTSYTKSAGQQRSIQNTERSKATSMES